MAKKEQNKDLQHCPACGAVVSQKSETPKSTLCACGYALFKKSSGKSTKDTRALKKPTNLPKAKKTQTLTKAKESLRLQDYNTAVEMLTSQLNLKPSEEVASYYLIAAHATNSKKVVNKALKEIDTLKYNHKKEWWLHTINTVSQPPIHFSPTKICIAFANQFKGHYLPLERLGEFQMKEKNFKEALKSYSKCIKVIEDFKLIEQEKKIYGKVLKNRATIYNRQKNYDLAIADYQRAIDADDKDYLAMKAIAEVFLTTHKYPQALKKLNQAISIKPKFLDAILLRANIKKQIKDYHGAFEDVKTILKIKPDFKVDESLMTELTNHQQQLKSESKDSSYERHEESLHLREKATKKELKALTKQLKETPKDPFLWYEVADFYFSVEDYANAIDAYNLALKYESNDQNIAYILNGRGLTYSHQDEYIKAILDYTHALEKTNNNSLKSSCYMNRAIAKGYMNDFRGSIKDLKEGIKLEKHPDEIQGYHYLLTRAYMELQEFDNAEKEINICIKDEKDNEELAEYLNIRASCKAAKGATEGAIVDLQKALKFKPNTTRYLVNLAYLQEATRKYEQSIKNLDKALSNTIDPDEAIEIYILRAGARINSQQPEIAIEDCLKAIELDQNHAIAYFQKGICNEMLGKKEDAIDDYEKALSLDPELEQAEEKIRNLNNDDEDQDYDEDDLEE